MTRGPWSIAIVRVATAFIGLSVLFVGCLGDLSVRVTVRNGTSEPIILYEEGRRYPQTAVRLGPGAERRTGFMYTDKGSKQVLAQVEATDEAGTLIFCRRYTYADVEQTSGRIEVRRGELFCD